MKQRWIGFLALAVLAVLLVGLVSCGFSYMEDDISSYVTLDKEAFDTILDRVTLDDEYVVTDEDVQDLIDQNLMLKKEAVNNAVIEESGTPGYGDNVRIWYSGTVTTESGEVVVVRDAASASDFSSSPLWYTIGAGTLKVEAIEEELQKIDIADYLTKTSGKIEEGMIYFLSYYNIDRDAEGKIVGNSARYNGINRVPAAEMDTLFGEGFRDKFYAETTEKDKEFDADKTEYITITMTGTFENGAVTREYHIRVCAQAEQDIHVTGTYKSGTYAGRPVELYVQIFGYRDYTVPELTKETAVSLFKMDADSEDPVADYREQVRIALLQGDTRQSVLQTAILEELRKCVTVHDLPKDKVKTLAKFYVNRTKTLYKEGMAEDMYDEFVNTYGEEAMQSLDAFAGKLLNGTEGESLKDAAWRSAEAVVREDLIIFAIVKYSGLELPDEEAINNLVDANLQEMMKDIGLTEEQIYELYGDRENFISDTYSSEIMNALALKYDGIEE